MFDKTPPKGMRDILPEDLLLREKISDTIKAFTAHTDLRE